MKQKILVIDDEELLTKTLVRLLEAKGYEVLISKNGQEALIILEEECFDLVLTDIRMPGMNGVEMIEQLRKTGNKTPVIFLTGYADSELERRARALAPNGYEGKPFDVAELLNKINAMMTNQ